MTAEDQTTPSPVEDAGSDAERLPGAPAESGGPPRFEFRAFWTAKRGNSENDWEDGFVADPTGGTLAVADGASDGVFTRLWVAGLLEGYRERPVPLDDRDAVQHWIDRQRKRWVEAIDYPALRWSLQRKVDRSCAAATFLGLRIGADVAVQEEGAVGWEAWAVGDVCLFHVRDNQLVTSFPVTSASEFGTTPALYQSKPLRPLPVADSAQGGLLPDDLIVVATDALACRLLGASEDGPPPDWSAFWDADPAEWLSGIERDRDAGLIVNDDCTLVAIRLPRVPNAADPAGPPSGADPSPAPDEGPTPESPDDWPWEPVDPAPEDEEGIRLP